MRSCRDDARRAAKAIALVAFLAACAEPSSIDRPVRPAAPREIVPLLLVSDSTAESVVLTISLMTGADSGRIGSFTARVSYDSTALTFLEEVPTVDGALRALNPTSGLVRIAGASAQGMEATGLASLRFRVRDARAIGGAHLDLDELHGKTRTDLLGLLRRSPRSARP